MARLRKQGTELVAAAIEVKLAQEAFLRLQSHFKTRPTVEDRTIGPVMSAPPLSRSTWTEDVALIAVQAAPQVNQIYLGFPHSEHFESFDIPDDGLFYVREIAPIHAAYDEDEKIIKRGRSTGLTVARCSTGFQSATWANGKVTREMCVVGLIGRQRLFSAQGGSGAAVINSSGQVVGLLTGGGGQLDLSYVTLMAWLRDSLKARFGLKLSLL